MKLEANELREQVRTITSMWTEACVTIQELRAQLEDQTEQLERTKELYEERDDYGRQIIELRAKLAALTAPKFMVGSGWLLGPILIILAVICGIYGAKIQTLGTFCNAGGLRNEMENERT